MFNYHHWCDSFPIYFLTIQFSYGTTKKFTTAGKGLVFPVRSSRIRELASLEDVEELFAGMGNYSLEHGVRR